MDTVVENPTAKSIRSILIPSGVHIGDKYTVKGKRKHTFAEDYGMSVNIAHSTCPNTDIAFQFNLRIDLEVVIRNSFHNGDWGTEERDIPYFPFNRWSEFTIAIEVHDYGYKVFVNGECQPYCTFEHRLGFNFHYLELTEGCDWSYVAVEKGPLHH